VNAASLARQLGGTGIPNSEGWLRCRCPVHASESFSLALKNGRHRRLIVKCWGGCTAEEVSRKLRDMILGGALVHGVTALPDVPVVAGPEDRSLAARRIWNATLPVEHTVTEKYLRGRGITLTPLPATLRHHPRLFHKTGNGHFPAMVAAVQDANGKQIAIHRTWLDPHGTNKANIDPNRMSLCATTGGALRLGEGGDALIIGEGIETSLSIMQLYGAPAWAALSSSGMQSIVIPAAYTTVVVAADNDPVGLAAANTLRRRLLLQGRTVRVIKPAESGRDFNDVLAKGAAA
jgi:putative DNA primase/helicase